MNMTEAIFTKDNTYFGQETIGGVPCTIGYTKEFRWSWMATQLNTFIFIGETNDLIDKAVIESFSAQCLKYALANHKGWPRGLQAGVGAIAILKGSHMTPEAVQFCTKLSKKHWSAFEIPVLYDTTHKKGIRFVQKPTWGAIYFPYFSKLIDAIFPQL